MKQSSPSCADSGNGGKIQQIGHDGLVCVVTAKSRTETGKRKLPVPIPCGVCSGRGGNASDGNQ